MASRRALIPLLLLAGAVPLAAQTWNDAPVEQLVRRAILLRETPAADTSLVHYRSQAHGFVFYLAQFGAGFLDPPRLAQVDELDVEVYWEAPDLSKQRIVAWRNGNFLPFTMNYHRDHLGIVTGNFGPRIRIGEGDEIRDAIHPLSLEGLDEYDFALGDTVTLATRKGPIDVVAVQVRPKAFERPLVVGTLYLERSSAALVRFNFSFTPNAYRNSELEDISVMLEQSLFEGRWWLPYRQQIEIRRRSAFFDFPARSIIKGTWEVGDYDFGAEFPAELRSAPTYGGLTAPRPDTLRWTTPLRTDAENAEPFDRRDFDALKTRAQDLVGRRVLEGLPHGRVGTTAVSDLLRVNRVQGVALGVGAGVRLNGGWSFRGNLGYGLSDHHVTAGLRVGLTRGASEWSFDVRRTVRDFGDEPVVSGVVNSFLSQEFAVDLGSYLLGEEAGVGLHRRLDARWSFDAAARFERSTTLATVANSVRRSYQPNPELGSGSYYLGRAVLTMAARGALDRGDFRGQLAVEGGTGESDYLRLSFRSDGSVRIPSGQLRLRTVAGVATNGLPRARSFAIGGRGTLPAERFRGYGGREVLAMQLEWRFGIPVPAIGLGPFATTGRRAILAPFVGVGWAGDPIPGLQWQGSDGARPVAGIAGEFLQQLLRVEAATVLRGARRLRITFDISPEWWPIL